MFCAAIFRKLLHTVGGVQSDPPLAAETVPLHHPPSMRSRALPQDAITLIGRALAGDATAGRALADRLMPVIQGRVCRRLVQRGHLRPEEADDVAQEIWLVLIRKGGRNLRGFDPNRGSSLENYVGMIADREAGNYRRRSLTLRRGGDQIRVDASGEEEEPATSELGPEDRLITDEIVAALKAHLEEQLSARGRLIFQLLHADGHPPAEVAHAMGVKIQVIYNWQHRIRHLVESFLAQRSSES